ncbi:MAG: hypothetical protein M0Q26_08205 [Chitinophagaceae bacterium]|nr:hypothetical protein [Chitinophagaceae bacterium]MDP1812442.1 hypothetical protein [Sediminibacterium sp.]MDP3129234.1 hypothetical protein [Sediminibacterium sp.]
MRLNFTLFILLLFVISTSNAQKLTGIWRGYFSSSRGLYNDGSRVETYKYEIQIDQQTNNGIKGVTYSYKTTVFYGKSELSGIYRPSARNLLIKETKLLDLKIGDNSEPCLMTCYLDYSKIGKLEVLEGTFISLNVKNKADCGSGKVYLERVPTSDFKKEDFLVRKNTIKQTPNKGKPVAQAPPAGKLPAVVLPGRKINSASGTPKTNKPPQVPIQKPAVAKKQPENPGGKMNPVNKYPKNLATGKAADRIPEPLVNSKKKEEGQTQQTETSSRKIPIPRVLLERENNLVRTITTSEENIQIDLYDNGTIDNDTISVYHNNELVISNGRLTYTPISIKIKCSTTDNRHELTVVAENLGDIPPNTALMVIKSGNQRERYEIFLTSTELRNAKVIINFVPQK